VPDLPARGVSVCAVLIRVASLSRSNRIGFGGWIHEKVFRQVDFLDVRRRVRRCVDGQLTTLERAQEGSGFILLFSLKKAKTEARPPGAVIFFISGCTLNGAWNFRGDKLQGSLALHTSVRIEIQIPKSAKARQQRQGYWELKT
jgi:hypothetical protein